MSLKDAFMYTQVAWDDMTYVLLYDINKIKTSKYISF